MNHDMAVFELLASMTGGGGDVGKTFPASDAQDFLDGARYIPGEVTLARRRGEKVTFNRNNHTWTMPDGKIVGA